MCVCVWMKKRVCIYVPCSMERGVCVYVCMYVCMSTTVPPARSSRRASGKVGLYYGMSMAGEA